MQRYHPAGAQWGIDYPQGWQVREAPSAGAVVFFQDDPDEGTAYAVVPFQTIQGELSATQVLQLIAQNVRRQNPDFQVKVQGTRDMSQGGMSAQALDADAAWTGGRRQAMRGAISLLVFSSRGSGTTMYIFLAGQGPAQGFGTLRPIFTRMTQSFGP